MARGLIIVLLLTACETPPPEPAPPPPAMAPPPRTPDPPSRLYVVLSGDLMLQDQIHDIAKERGGADLASGYAWFLHDLQPLLSDLRSRGDLRLVVNLESPVASERHEPRSFPPRFNGPPEALLGLARAGVTDVTLANNHALDQGRSGLLETLENARAAGLGTAGAGPSLEKARAPLLLGTTPRVALLAYYLRPGSRGEPSSGAVMAVLDERSLDEVRLARSLADAVIVTIHWVGEFRQNPPEDLVQQAESLVLAGADAVVCHGPHVLGPTSIVETDGRQALIAYSLGNLLSNMGWEVYPTKPLEPGKDSAQRIEAREQALAVLEFTKPSPDQTLSSVALVPLWLMDNRYAVYRKDAGPRLIYPLPLVNCTLPDPLPCFPASKPSECEALATTLETLVSRPTFQGFCGE